MWLIIIHDNCLVAGEYGFAAFVPEVRVYMCTGFERKSIVIVLLKDEVVSTNDGNSRPSELQQEYTTNCP